MATDVPSCFGIVWEAVGQSVCVGCGIHETCLHKFALDRLKKIRDELGEKATVEELCNRTGVKDPEAILAAIEYATAHGEAPLKSAVPKKKPVLKVVPEPEPEPEKEAMPEPEKVIPPPSQPTVESAPPVLVSEIPPPPEAAEVATDIPPPPDTGGVEEQKEVRVKKAPKGKKKKSTASHPQKAGSAKSALGPALAKAKRSALPVKAQESTRRVWGEQTWVARWQRERERSPELASLAPGMKLNQLYKGNWYQAEVINYGYRYLGREYPTLYAVTAEALGTYQSAPVKTKGRYRTPGYSAMKFWGKSVREAIKGTAETTK